MPIPFTEQQKKAIDSRGGRLLVSAAAGSGKTAVLVQRVIELVCGAEPVDVDRLLVVTFTNAAASEMRSKIASALLDRLALEPNNIRLRRQLALLPGARIQTVHAFCMDLVRQNFALCGVSPDFSLADETEYSLLKDAAMEETLENAYASDTPQFEALQYAFCEERGDERLAGIVREIYECLRSHPDPDGWLERAGEADEGLPPEQTDWGAYLLECARGSLRFAASGLESVLHALEDAPELLEKYRPVLGSLLEQADEIQRAMAEGWDSAVDAVRAFFNPRLPSVRGGDEQLRERVKNAKKLFADRVKAIGDRILCAHAGEIAQENAQARPLVQGLCGLVRDFSARYAEEKKKRGLLDFSDLEHLALGLLTDGQGGRTPLAEQLSQSLSELLVDEYQDTNEIQDRIFDAVAPAHGGVFQVGDVKQSIYRFRLAEPGIFVDKYRRYADYDAPDAAERRLPLNRNFRSRPEVLELCNFLFSRLMSRHFGEVDYDESERLYPGADNREGHCPSEVCVIDMQGARDDEDSPEKAQAEARYAAGRIAALLQTHRVTEKDGSTRPARPGDFAILLSSFRSKAPFYRQALQRAGIPAAAGEDGFFDAMEVQIMLSFLRIIDNRRQDVPLISVLRSPLFFFSPDDLTEIRECDRQGAFCDALTAAAAAGRGDARQFLDLLDELCSRAVDLTVSELLQLIYSRTGAMGVFAALDRGENRRRNLSRLLGMAMSYEGRSARGIHAFLRFLDRKAEDESEVPGAPAGSDAVQLLSIHKSKGLEYPIVIVPDLAKSFNADDLKKPVLFHQKMGIGIRLRDERSHAEYATQLYRAVAARITAEQRAEELRKLYVALTRAREKLIVTLALPDVSKKLTEWAPLAGGGPIDPEALSAQTSCAMWVCAPLLNHPAGGPLRALCPGTIPVSSDADADNLRVSVVHYTEIPDDFCPPQAVQPQQTEDFSALLAQMDVPYAYADVSALPSKLTPTGAKRLMPDAGEIEQAEDAPRVHFYQTPSGDGPYNARARGTATHLLLSLADYEVCAQPGGVERELARLTAQRKMTEQQAQLVSRQTAARYFEGPLAARVRAAGRVLREYEFGALFTPRELLGEGRDDEQILMNGIIDLLLFEPDGLCVVDFKTDRVQPGGEEQAAQRHRLQLDIYAAAAQKIFGQPVRSRVVYFLQTGRAITL